MIAKIDPCRVARWPTLALSKFRTANQHYGHRLLEGELSPRRVKIWCRDTDAQASITENAIGNQR
jgi:hypothetical protein